jgi:hypothetical protein
MLAQKHVGVNPVLARMVRCPIHWGQTAQSLGVRARKLHRLVSRQAGTVCITAIAGNGEPSYHYSISVVRSVNWDS